MPKILIADDEKVVRDILVRFLTLKGYEVAAVKDGKEVLDKAGAEDFALLIMDLKMPGLRSSEVLLKLKDSGNNIPVIILTGTIDADESGDLRKIGFTDKDIICKPADLFELLNMVKEKINV